MAAPQTYLIAAPAKELYLCRCQAAYNARVHAAAGITPHPNAAVQIATAESILRARLAAHPDLIAPAIAELEDAIVKHDGWAGEAWGRSQKSALGQTIQGRKASKREAAEHREHRDMHAATLAVLREFAP